LEEILREAKSKQGTSAGTAVAPEETKPAPAQEIKPAPAQAAKPAPERKPAPEPEKSAPAQTAKPAQEIKPAQAAKPAQETKSAPAQERKPAPEPEKPALAQTAKLVQEQEIKPAPAQTAKPAQERKPAPEPEKPAPAQTAKPAQEQEIKSAPAQAAKPAQERKPAPAQTANPAQERKPAQAAKPAPAGGFNAYAWVQQTAGADAPVAGPDFASAVAPDLFGRSGGAVPARDRSEETPRVAPNAFADVAAAKKRGPLGVWERLLAFTAARFKTNRPIVIIAPLVLALIIVAIVVYLVLRIGVYEINEPVLRFENGIDIVYEGETRLTRDEDTGKVTLANEAAGGEEIVIAAPLYFPKDSKRVLTPNLMIAVFPELGRIGSTVYYTEIKSGGGKCVATMNGKEKELPEGFLFDGDNTYLFLRPMTVKWDLNEIELPALSYAIAYHDLRVEIYSPDGGIKIVEQTGDARVRAYAEKDAYSVDLGMDILYTEKGEHLLITRPELLDEIELE
jgi:hypothetical protein